MRDLESVLADWRERASSCRRVRDERVADLLDEVCTDVADATEDYRKWLSESDAMIRCGRKRYWLRARFGEWAHAGLARWSPKNARLRELPIELRRQQTAYLLMCHTVPKLCPKTYGSDFSFQVVATQRHRNTAARYVGDDRLVRELTDRSPCPPLPLASRHERPVRMGPVSAEIASETVPELNLSRFIEGRSNGLL